MTFLKFLQPILGKRWGEDRMKRNNNDFWRKFIELSFLQ
jgi:hypothetical protein